ncbi:MAG: glutathione S-transferase N-terminal domain-containing protein [Candidatus Omnitrophica bacterium]|nr:glutathione S-transferase N-terminal domain-containing protein [Candidatus Omnitrophota bacterium]MCF7898136.1 glutathione S-transferase N-terminal domain-containing protein [Candidatus Omnitrophota bacterium]
MMAEKVLVYGTPTCPYCQKVKEYLKENNIDFTNYDVSSDQEKLEEMKDKSGQMGVPVVEIDGKIIKGFDQEKLNQVLGI